jgi:hypothetical protein
MARTIRSQKRVKGQKRQPVGSAFIAELEAKVAEHQKFYGVSRSFVIAVAVAEALRVGAQERYYETRPAKLRRIR